MISAMRSMASWAERRLRRAPRQAGDGADPWSLYQLGRACEGRGDIHRAFHCHLQAGLAGLPVAAIEVWLSYRTGCGVSVDSVAADAWAQRATRLGWPNVFRVREACESPERQMSGDFK